METAYVVGVELALKGGLERLLPKLLADFDKLGSTVDRINGSLKAATASARNFAEVSRSAADSWRSIAASTDRAAKAAAAMRGGAAPGRSIAASEHETRQPYRNVMSPYAEPRREAASAPSVSIAAERDEREPRKPYSNTAVPGPEPRRQPSAFARPPSKLPTGGDPFMGGLTAAGGYAVIKNSVIKAADLANEQALLTARGFSPAQVKKATDEAYKLVRTVAGSTVMGNLGLLADLQKVTQSPAEALKLLGPLAQLQVDYDRVGMKGGAAEMLAVARVAESRGLFIANPKTGQVDTSRFQKFAESLLATAVTFGIDPEQLLTFSRRAGYSAANLSDTAFLSGQAALIQALGASQAGSALAGMSRQFGAGKMSVASGNELIDLGIIKGGGTVYTNPYVKKNGPFNVFVKPGGFDPGVQLMMAQHPEQFISQILFPKIDAYLGKLLGDKFTKAGPEQRAIYETQLSTQLASSQTGSKELAETLRLKALIDRDMAAGEEAAKRNLDTILKTSPKNTFAGLPAAVDALQRAVGKDGLTDVVGGIKGLTDGLAALTKWANANPTGTKLALEGMAAGLGALAVGSAANLALLALGGPGGLLAGLGIGILALYKGVNALDKMFPSPKSPQGWADVPGTRLWFDKKFEGMFHHSDSATPNGVPKTGPLFGPQQTKSAAPVGTPTAPLAVHITNDSINTHVTNTDDLSHSVGVGLAHSMNTPSKGVTGLDASTSDISPLWSSE